MAVVSSTCYVSAPTSPERRLLNALIWYSHEPGTDRVTPTFHEETRSCLDGFEFETSRRFCYAEDEPLVDGGKASLAFADELFSDGKVLPLKPPPKMGRIDKGSARSSPRALSWRILWNDDFDPFETALVNVREEECWRGRKTGEGIERRARSMSPLRNSVLDEPCDAQSSRLDWEGVKALRCSNPTKEPETESRQTEKAVWSPKKMVRSRGLEFARRVRLVRSRNGGKVENAEPIVDDTTKSNRGQKIKKLLLQKKTNSIRRSNGENIGISRCCNEKKRQSKMVKMALGHHRPKFLLCFGYRLASAIKLGKV